MIKKTPIFPGIALAIFYLLWILLICITIKFDLYWSDDAIALAFFTFPGYLLFQGIPWLGIIFGAVVNAAGLFFLGNIPGYLIGKLIQQNTHNR